MKSVSVYLANWDVIKIVSNFEINEKELTITKDGAHYAACFYKDYHYIRPNHVYYFFVGKNLELGTEYFLTLNSSSVRIDLSPASLLNDFDELYGYSGDDLGNQYRKSDISFAFWCPHATRVSLEYRIGKDVRTIGMERTEKGVWRVNIPMTDSDVYYRYRALINGNEVVGYDPYCRYGFNNLEWSVASNKDVSVSLNKDRLLPLSHIENIIYETNVRDFTIHKNTDIVNKGKFLGLSEENRVTKGGHPAGLDYLKYLGITTLQLQPIFNVATIDENNPNRTYNWGYDPNHYFVLEGSYSSDVSDPTQAVRDFKAMVGKLHENNIRVSIDVVFNHMYNPKTNILEKFVPYYYFRRDGMWKLSNCSGCGGDFATERTMGRKMVIDSLVYLVKDLGVDAVRFDLMGLIDLTTIKEAYKKCQKIDKNVYFYGEGWSMGAEPHDHGELATMENAFKIPEIGFFNDRFRNIVKGIGGAPKQSENGFVLGNQDFVHGFRFVNSGSCLNEVYPPIFARPSQSINYVECHDNAALMDVINESLIKEDDITNLRYLDLMNKVLLTSVGVPFIHAGQEIGFSKKNHHNTYDEGDRYNNFDYSLLDNRFEHAELVRNMIAIRKQYKLFRTDEAKAVGKAVRYTELPKGILIAYDTGYDMIVNPTESIIYYTRDAEGKFVYLERSEITSSKEKISYTILPKISLVMIKDVSSTD